jgi:hypothetical protein
MFGVVMDHCVIELGVLGLSEDLRNWLFLISHFLTVNYLEEVPYVMLLDELRG